MDQSLFAAPHGFSQRITSFIACACQGIHQMPLIHLIVLIANAHRLFDLDIHPPRLRLKAVPNLTSRTPWFSVSANVKSGSPSFEEQPSQTSRCYLLQQRFIDNTINVFDMIFIASTPVHREVISIRPASRDQIQYRAVRQR